MNRVFRGAGSLRAVVLAALALAAPALLERTASAQVVINEVLSSNRRAALDDDGDSSDLVELFNAGSVPVSLAEHSLSDDPLMPLKWVFPSVTIEPGGFLQVWCSGKNRDQPRAELIEAEDSSLSFSADYLDADSEWAVLTGSLGAGDFPLGWSTLAFDDSAWRRGVPGFGYDENGLVEGLRTDFPREIRVALLRAVFQVDSVEAMTSLVFETAFNDGFIVYVNGERAGGVNASTREEPSFAARSTRRRSDPSPVRIDLSSMRPVLRDGANVIGIVALNWNELGRDFWIAPRLGTVPPVLHTNFRLDASGEAVVLSGPGGEFVDGLVYREQFRDRSLGRYPDGVDAWYHMLFPTPGAANDHHIATQPIPSAVDVSPEAGVHEDVIEVSMAAAVPFDGFEVRFTLNGSPPLPDSTLYDGSFELNRDAIVRAAGFLDGRQVTDTATRTYLLGGQAQSLVLPIMAISMDPEDFIFVHLGNDGRGREFEREAHMELFDVDGRPAASTGFGLRLHGGAGRGGDINTKKAYKAYFRSEYGDAKLRYPVIPDTVVEEFDKLVLRSNFNDAFRTGDQAAYIRDQVFRDLHAEMGAVVSHGSWYNLFINGRYRGLYNVVERMDKDFLASYFPDDGESWDVVKTGNDILDGDIAKWNELGGFLRTRDLRDSAQLAEAHRIMDVENYAGYMLLNIWGQNHDWPHNNWYAARPRRDDGRWMFLSWDAEFGIGRIPSGWTSDTFTHVFQRSGLLTDALANLLRNSNYQREFVAHLDALLEGVLSVENVVGHIDRLEQLVAADMVHECALAGRSIRVWEANVQAMRVFALRRNPVIRDFIVNNSTRITFVTLESVVPASITPVAPATVQLRGTNLTPQTRVWFSVTAPEGTYEIAATSSRYVSSRELAVEVPFDIRLEGDVSIRVDDAANGAARLDDALDVRYIRPELESVTPATGSVSGGDLVRIRGANFTDGVRVEFGGVAAPSVTRVDDSTDVLDVLTPPGFDSVDVRVFNTRPADLPAPTALRFDYEDRGEFRRGDVNGDGSRNISDVVSTLHHLFGGARQTFCHDAMDTNDSGGLDLSDPVLLLEFLFRANTGALAAPVSSCAPDPTEDALTCTGPRQCIGV